MASKQPLLTSRKDGAIQHSKPLSTFYQRLYIFCIKPISNLHLFIRILCVLTISIPMLVYIGTFLVSTPHFFTKPLFPNELLDFHLLTESERLYLWKQWKRQFSPDFSDMQEIFRRNIFFENCEYVAQNNREAKGNSAILHINEHAALTDEEFRAAFTGLFLEGDRRGMAADPLDEIPNGGVPEEAEGGGAVPSPETAPGSGGGPGGAPGGEAHGTGDAESPHSAESIQYTDLSPSILAPDSPGDPQFPLAENQFDFDQIDERPSETKAPKKNWESWEVDWHKSGFTTRVKNQGKCGACWAFSSTAALESRCAIRGWNLVSLSVQELVDCAERRSGYRNDGCIGGFVSSAFDYIMHNTGSLRWENYHHYSRGVKHCKERTNITRFDMLAGYHNIAPNAVDAMRELESGPITAAVFASHKKFRFYKRGIITSNCPNTIDHGVTVVGFGEENGIPFWKIKNSWGDHWGEEGYVRICRGCTQQYGGQCGVLKQLQAPECLDGVKLAIPADDWGASMEFFSLMWCMLFFIIYL